MDEVFGNSSTETVVSIQELEKYNSSSELSPSVCYETAADVETNIASEEGKTSKPESTEASSCCVTNGNESNYSNSEEACHEPATVARVSVIKTVMNSSKNDDFLFKIPYPPLEYTAPLKHTQSAVVSRPVNENKRPRSHSTAVSTQSSLKKHYHPYQNIPLNLNKKLSPIYANIPRRSPLQTVFNDSSYSPNNRSQKVNSAYIQLWTGVRQKRNLSESDSDDTVDSSRLSETGYVKMSSPYVRSPSSSILFGLAQQLASVPNTEMEDIFCPFCPRPFRDESSFCNHIQAIHRHELQKIICGERPILVQHCPLCHGRFFNLQLLPSHLLEFHRESLVKLLDKHQCLEVDSSYVKCPFCNKKVSNTKIGDVLLYHFLQLHNIEYENLIYSIFKPVSSDIKEQAFSGFSIEDITQAFKFNQGTSSTPGLSIKFQTLSCELETEIDSSCTKETETWSSHCIDDKNITYLDHSLPAQKNKGILRSQTDLSRKPSVKRELRFHVPPVTSEEIYVPESPEASTYDIESDNTSVEDYFPRHNIPVRVDSLSSADFIELNHQASRKRRKLGIGLKSKKNFKNKDKENIHFLSGLKNVSGRAKSNQKIVATSATRTFRKPRVPISSTNVTKETVTFQGTERATTKDENKRISTAKSNSESNDVDISPFSNVKLYSPLRMFMCNRCFAKFCDNESLSLHIRCRHRGLLGFLRPHFGCGICEAKFYENKYLVKHCLQHHTSLLEIRSPNQRKISIYNKLSQN